jgi:hypothetical protein
MQDIYRYIPETNHAPKEYNVATIPWLLFMVPIIIIIIIIIIINVLRYTYLLQEPGVHSLQKVYR